MNAAQKNTAGYKKFEGFKFVSMTDLGSARLESADKVAFIYFDGTYVVTKK